MRNEEHVFQIKARYKALSPLLDERSRRQWAAAEALSYGYGGRRNVSAATGLSPNTISKGMKELEERRRHPGRVVPTRLRCKGGGRKRVEKRDAALPKALERLVDPGTLGDPCNPLRWTSKSTRHLSEALARQKHAASPRTVARLLKEQGYSLQGNRKAREGAQHPDRDAQFEHINAQALRFMRERQPVISVDTKKKELVGNYKNNGRKWHRKGEAHKVNSHDFPGPEVPRAFPYGVYDPGNNVGFVNVGTDHDTSAFAVASIRAWWQQMGKAAYPRAKHIQIMADSGGSNGYRRRLWKWELQRLADETELPIRACHFPPGTSKWNKVEHRLFSFISQNWKGEPLTSYETIVKLISATTTETGLKVERRLDMSKYPLGQEVSKEDWKSIRLRPAPFHGEWNYEILPRVMAKL
jgi:hypothetical protein